MRGAAAFCICSARTRGPAAGGVRAWKAGAETPATPLSGNLKRSGLMGGASGRRGPGELRRLDRCWPRGPEGRVIVEWEVLMVVAEKPGGMAP